MRARLVQVHRRCPLDVRLRDVARCLTPDRLRVKRSGATPGSSELTGQSFKSTPLRAEAEKRYSSSVGIFSSGGGAPLPAQILAGQRRGRAPHERRFFLSHFPLRRTSSKPTGPETAIRSSCGDARFVNAIRSSATDAAASRPTMSITTGSGSGAVAAPIAGRPSPSCPCFLSLTRTTACWLAVRPCDGASWRTGPGKRRRPRSKTPIVCPIPPPSAAGRAAWTAPNRRLRFGAKRSPAWPVG